MYPTCIFDFRVEVNAYQTGKSSVEVSAAPDSWLCPFNTLDNTDTETISASRFIFIDSLVVSALQDAGGYAISHKNNVELHLGCHNCWLSYFTLVCLWCGWTDGRAGVQLCDYQIFSDG